MFRYLPIDILVAPHKFAFAGKADMLTPTPRRLMRQLLLPKDFPPSRKYDPVQWGFNCRIPKWDRYTRDPRGCARKCLLTAISRRPSRSTCLDSANGCPLNRLGIRALPCFSRSKNGRGIAAFSVTTGRTAIGSGSGSPFSVIIRITTMTGVEHNSIR